MNRRRYAPFSTRFGGRRVGDEGGKQAGVYRNYRGRGRSASVVFYAPKR